ncbi:MAG: hypothetical protein ACRDNJ_13050 [Solirubrobacteraceae bacterium]
MSGADRAGGWTAAEPPSISFQLASIDGACWERGTGSLAALELRDLRLGAAGNGALGAWHLCVAARSSSAPARCSRAASACLRVSTRRPTPSSPTYTG